MNGGGTTQIDVPADGGGPYENYGSSIIKINFNSQAFSQCNPGKLDWPEGKIEIKHWYIVERNNASVLMNEDDYKNFKK